MKKFIFIFLILINSIPVFADSSPSYVMPFWLPTPAWGITQDATAPAATCKTAWDANTTCTGGYYICDSCVGSTDTSNPNGKPLLARKTIPLALTAGAYVEIHGTYTKDHTSGGQSISCAGSRATYTLGSAGMIWIRGYDTTTNRPTLTKPLKFLGCKYTVIENLKFDFSGTTGTGGSFGSTSMIFWANNGGDASVDCSLDSSDGGFPGVNRNCVDHVWMRDVDWYGNTDSESITTDKCYGSIPVGSGVIADFRDTAAWHNIGFLRLRFYNFRKTTAGRFNASLDLSCSMITPNATGHDANNHVNITHDIYFLDSVCSVVPQSCMQIGGGDSADNAEVELVQRVFEGRVTADKCGKSCFALKSSSQIVYSQLDASAVFDNFSQPSPSKCWGVQQGSRDFYVVFSKCRSNSYGFFMGSDNNSFGGSGIISAISRTSNVVTATIPSSTSAFLFDGMKVRVKNVTDTSFNGDFIVTAHTTTSLTWSQTAANASSSSGSVLIADTNHDWYSIGNIYNGIEFGQYSSDGCGTSSVPGVFNPTGSSPCGTSIGGANFPENLYILFNTFYNDNAFFNVQQGPSTFVTATPHVYYGSNLHSKILIDAYSTSKGYAFRIDNNTAWDNLTTDHNLWCFASDPTTCSGTDTGSLGWKRSADAAKSTFNTYTGSFTCTGCLATDPDLNDPASGDFTLKSTSAARNAGDITLYNTAISHYNTIFGTTVTAIDYAGNALDGTPDIGAFQYGSAPSTTRTLGKGNFSGIF